LLFSAGGIWMSFLVIDKAKIIRSFYDAVMELVRVFQSEGNTKTIMFSALVGALILFVQKSGGTEGFVRWVQSRFKNAGGTTPERIRKKLMLMAWLTGIIVFVETSISSLTVGTVFRPLFDKFKISREKLAYLADSSSAPVSVLLPFNAWGGVPLSWDYYSPKELKNLSYGSCGAFLIIFMHGLLY